MIVIFPPEIEKKIIALAAQNSIEPALLVTSLIEKQLIDELAMPSDEVGSDFDPDALHRAVAGLLNRTPLQIKAAQEKAIKKFKPISELSSEVSPFEVIPKITGDETEEQVLQALTELS